jgi:DNA-binding XRE family transcriptional regulator
MIRSDLLNGEIARAGMSKAELARKIGMAPKTFYRKEKLGVFCSDEIVKIVFACMIKEPVPIFFPEFVTHQATEVEP